MIYEGGENQFSSEINCCIALKIEQSFNGERRKKMKRKMSLFAIVVTILMGMVLTTVIQTTEAGRGDGPIIYVTGQDLFYDSIVTANLPRKGPFQRLYPCDQELCTEFGPGDTEYVGGRWWLDNNNNEEHDGGDSYFSCPLLPPGRENP
jgi:hypothetical protein